MNKVAVIGLGNISKRHRANLRKLCPEAKIFAISASGRHPNEAIDNADEFFLNIEHLLPHKIDMAIVASPATYHAQHAIPLLKAGIPVLIEKPLSANAEDAEAIISAAKQTKTPVAVGYCLRYLSSSKKIKKMLEEKVIGDIYNVSVEAGQYLPDWRAGKNYRNTVSANVELGGGALLELSHEIDYVQWLFGSLAPHSAILRSSTELDLEVEDFADILAINDSSTVFTIHLDFLQRKACRKCRVNGSRGSLEWDLLRNQIKIISSSGDQLPFDESGWDRNQIYLDMLNDFRNNIAGHEHQCVTLAEAQQTVLLIEKVKNLALKR